MPTKIPHISDLHFGPHFVPVVAQALLQTIPSLAPDANMVEADLTQRARQEQFEQGREHFERLFKPHTLDFEETGNFAPFDKHSFAHSRRALDAGTGLAGRSPP